MKIALCGVGQRLAYLVDVFRREDPSIGFACYCDGNPVGMPYLRERGIDIGKPYDDVRRLLDENSDVDLLMIGSPNHFHLTQIREALRRGIQVFTEKPVVVSELETYELLDTLARCAKDAVMVGLVLRYSPLYQSLIQFRDSGGLGDISSIEASEHISPAHGAFFMRNWRRYTSYTGGFMLEKCCHDLDLYQGLIAKRPRRVASFGGRRTFVPRNKHLEQSEVYHAMKAGWQSADSVFESDSDIVDFQTALIEYQDGENLCFHTNLNVADKFRHFCAIGSKATAEGDFERNFLRIHSSTTGDCLLDESYKLTSPLGHYGAEEEMARDIIAHLRDARPLLVGVIDALEAGMTALMIDKARTSGVVLDLDGMWARFDRHARGEGSRGGIY